MKELINRLLNGETLTDEERAQLAGFDPDSLAAAARKKGEASAEEWKSKYEKLYADSQTAGKGKQTELDQLKERVASLETAKAAAEAETGKLRRAQELDNILKASGIKFIDGVDPEILKGAFSRTFDGVEDLTDEAAVKELVGTFRSANKGLILDTTGNGSGRQILPGANKGQKNPWAKDSFNLTEQVSLERSNPAEAARLKAAAE